MWKKWRELLQITSQFEATEKKKQFQINASKLFEIKIHDAM